LGQVNNLHKAVHLGKQYISQAIDHADELEVGKGHGPVHHFFAGHTYVL
ncbi:bifunctional hydroxymethylpyrimidine kinase/phosphomethylpyrimidine kinase, partial [Vibrio parahaemolyticus]|nr:bifunctional hydroxymethylpyrimidine kinase/phosphomethylpyrimidine kinase [Vibrio parahaemolyticus]